MKNIFSKIFLFLGDLELSLLFFLLFVFSLPFSKRIEFWSPYSHLEGRFVEYTTYIVYGFEVFLCISLAAWVWSVLRKKKDIAIGDKYVFISVLLLASLTLVSSLYSADRCLSIYYGFVWIVLLLVYIFMINKIKTKRTVFLFFNVYIFSMLMQSIIAVVQFIKDSSLGLSLIGEYPLSPLLSGVAKTVIDGAKHIRAYGTFSHPNILALFLVLAGIICIHLFYSYKDRAYRLFLLLSMSWFLFALFLTFSRVAWLLALVTWTWLILRSINKKDIFAFLKNRANIFFVVVLFSLFSIVILYFLSAIWWRIDPYLATTWDSLIVRGTVFFKTFDLIWQHPFGVGAGSFVIQIAYLLSGYPLWMAEPVHNTFLMVFAEVGFLGFLSFLFIVCRVFSLFRKIPLFLKMVFISIFVYMFFDHSFWDIRQVQYLFIIFVGLIIIHSRGLKSEEIGHAS